MSTSISINTTNTETGMKKQKSVSYIDPQASSESLIAFSEGIANLMADTRYDTTTRIDRTECNVNKITRVISSIASLSGATIEEVGGVYKITIQASAVSGTPKAVNVVINSVQLRTFPTYTPYIKNLQITGGFAFYSFRIEKQNISRITTYFTQDNQPTAGEKISGTIVIPEDQTYKELAVPFEITLT